MTLRREFEVLQPFSSIELDTDTVSDFSFRILLHHTV